MVLLGGGGWVLLYNYTYTIPSTNVVEGVANVDNLWNYDIVKFYARSDENNLQELIFSSNNNWVNPHVIARLDNQWRDVNQGQGVCISFIEYPFTYNNLWGSTVGGSSVTYIDTVGSNRHNVNPFNMVYFRATFYSVVSNPRNFTVRISGLKFS